MPLFITFITTIVHRFAVPLYTILLVWSVVVLALTGSVAAAEPLPGAATHPAGVVVEEVAPELFYLQDNGGSLVPVPGFRYRDFVDLLRLKEGLPGLPETPAAVLESIVIKANLPAVGADHTICPVNIELVVRQSRPGWVSVPLELAGVLLSAAPRHEGQGRLLLAVDSNAVAGQQRGYRAWFNNASDGTAVGLEDVRHTVILAGNVAVDSSPMQASLALCIPAATASLVELRTPLIEPVVTVLPQSLEPRVEKAPEREGSVVTLVGLSGPTQILLGSRQSDRANVGALPQSMVESLVRIDGNVVVTEAILRLENLAPEVSTLRISLPPRTTLRSVKRPTTLVERTGVDEAPVVIVQIDRDAAGRAVVELECERSVDRSGKSAFEPLGFAVADIPLWRQWGRVSIVVEGDWQTEWDDPGNNRRIDPPLAARRPGFVAAFAYDSQPATLPMRVRPRGSRVVVEPEYRYRVGATRIALDVKLRVSVRGAPISRLVIGLEGWGVDEVGPTSIVNTTAITGDGGTLVIPFLQGLSGDAVIDIRCGRTLERTADRVEWKIPSPQADLVGPALVVIVSDSDIELLPDTEAIRGLVRQVSPTATRLDADKGALAYRVDNPNGIFSAARRFLARRVGTTVTTQIAVHENGISVEETIRFSVAHVPMEFVELLIPEVVLRSASLEVRQDGELLNLNSIPTNEPEADQALSTVDPPSEAVPVRLLLSSPLLGSGELSISYKLPTPSVPPETTVAENLPMVLPVGTSGGKQTLLLNAHESFAIDVRGDAWQRSVGTSAASAARIWTATKPQQFVPLTLTARQRSVKGDTVVEAAWLETRLLSDGREDLFTYAISTSADQLNLTLPMAYQTFLEAHPVGDAVRVWLDGQLIPGAVRPEGRVVVDLPAEKVDRNNGMWLLELRGIRQQEQRPAGSGFLPESVVLESPVFPAETLLRRFYWELRLESDEHVVVSPLRWSSQQRWAWNGFGIARTPIVSREVLNTWVRGGATAARQATAVGGSVVAAVGTFTPTEAARVGYEKQRSIDLPLVERRAVYSGVGSPGIGNAWVMQTWLLVLLISGPVLALGLSFVYRRSMQRSAVVLTIAACLAMAAVFFIDLAPLIAQAALPGVSLSLLAAGLHAMLNRKALAARSQAGAISSSSLTTAFPLPSIIVARSSVRLPENVVAAGRSAS